MTPTLNQVRELAMGLSREEKAVLVRVLANEVGPDFPGITKTPGVCGGDACVAGTRIPVWLLEAYRRDGTSLDELVGSYPSLSAQDIVLAWAYAERYRTEIEQAIEEQERDDED